MIPSKRIRQVTMGSTNLDARVSVRPPMSATGFSLAETRARLQRPLRRGEDAAARLLPHRGEHQGASGAGELGARSPRAAMAVSGSKHASPRATGHFLRPTAASAIRNGSDAADGGGKGVGGGGDGGTLHLAATAMGNSNTRALDPTLFSSMGLVNRIDEATANDTAVNTRGSSLAGRRDASNMPQHTGMGFRPSSGPSIGHGLAATLVSHRMPVVAVARSGHRDLSGAVSAGTGSGIQFQGSIFRPHRPRDTASRNRPTGMGAMPGAVALVSSERSLPAGASPSLPAMATGAELDATDQWESDSDDAHGVGGGFTRNGPEDPRHGTGRDLATASSKRVGFAAMRDNPPATPVRSTGEDRFAAQASRHAPSVTQSELNTLAESARHRHRPAPRPSMDAFKLAGARMAPKLAGASAAQPPVAHQADAAEAEKAPLPPHAAGPPDGVADADRGASTAGSAASGTAPAGRADVRDAVRQIRSALSDTVFGQLCAELESADRHRAGVVGWQDFARVLSRLVPRQPLRGRQDVARLVAATGCVLRPGRQVDYVQFFDRVAPTQHEAEAVASGAADVEAVLGGGLAVRRAERAVAALRALDEAASLESQLSRDTSRRRAAGERSAERAEPGDRRAGRPAESSALSQPEVPRKVLLAGGSEAVELRDLSDVAHWAAGAAEEGGGGAPTSAGVTETADVVTGSVAATTAGKRTTALRMREEAIRARLKLVSDRPTKVTAADVVRLMRERAVRSSMLAAFRNMDVDNNGVLDLGEIRGALRRLRLDLPVGEAEALVQALDVNGDGVVQWDEWTAFMADRQREEAAERALGRAERREPSGRLSPVTAAHHSARAEALARIDRAARDATSSSLTAARHNPPPATACAMGNKRGLVRTPAASRRLQVIARAHPEVVAAFPLTLSDCASLVRRLDVTASSFVGVEDLQRHLLREAARLTKAGVSSLVDARATVGAVAQATALPETDAGGVRHVMAEKVPLDSFPVSDAVRQAARDVAMLCDTNGDGWVQADDVAEVGRVLARHTVAGRANPMLGFEAHTRGAAEVAGIGIDADTKEGGGGSENAGAITARLVAVGANRRPVISDSLGVPATLCSGTGDAKAAETAQSASESHAPTLTSYRLQRVHPSVRDAASHLARKHAALDGTAKVALAWLVSDSDSDDDLAAPGTGETAPAPAAAMAVPALPMDALRQRRARDAELRVPVPASERRKGQRRAHAFSARAEAAPLAAMVASTERSANALTARVERDAASGDPWATATHSLQRGVARGGQTAGVHGSASHGFAAKARHAARHSPRVAATRAAMARAMHSPRFDATDPTAFQALSARGARHTATRLGGKAAELAESTDRVVKPRQDVATGMEAGTGGGMETEAQATMREG